MSKTVELVEQIVQPVVETIGLELVEVEYVKEGRDWFLRIYVDKDGGVDLDDCAAASEKISQFLDENDPIKEQYFLEVSSPGAERPLKKKEDIEKAIGKQVNIKLYEAIQGEKEFEGQLVEFDGTEVTLEIRVKTARKKVVLPYEKIAKARLAVVF